MTDPTLRLEDLQRRIRRDSINFEDGAEVGNDAAVRAVFAHLTEAVAIVRDVVKGQK